jgi:uncharacterized protein YjcR
MPKKAQRAERLVAALKKLHRLEELKKIELQRQLGELRRSEEAVIDALNREDVLQGLFLDTSSRFLRSLARQAERVSEAHKQQSQQLLERAGTLRQAEKLRDKHSQRRRKVDGDKHLDEVIERYSGKRGTSLP